MVSFELYVTITKQKSINNRILHKTEYMYVCQSTSTVTVLFIKVGKIDLVVELVCMFLAI